MHTRTITHAGKVAAAMGLILMLMPLASDSSGSAHPGNVFVFGEDVRAAVPATWRDWTAIDVDGKNVGQGPVRDSIADLGKLPVGYYEIREKDGMGPIKAGVVAANTPVDNAPVALEAAMSWFYAESQQIRDASRLCKLAGVNWVRDRASWPEIEAARGTWAGETRYERAMRIQREMGLKILQVNHIAPAWAGGDAKRFPEDLREVYRFYKGLARGAETLNEFSANEAYPYLDRYGLNHYVRLHEYPRAYGRHRAVSGGRPTWVTEFNLPVWWEDEKTKEPSEEELRFQAYRVGKVFAQSLHEGAQKSFYFILGHYVERNLQYGLVHQDLTPRPAYVAFAAVGRLLNGAKPLGRVDLGDEKLKAFAFNTVVDGARRETVVAWSEGAPTPVEIRPAERAYDYLGRDMAPTPRPELGRETLFLILPPGGSKALSLDPPPVKASWREGKTSPVVLQLIGQGDVKQSAFRIDKSADLRLVAYNFGPSAARGILSVKGAAARPRSSSPPADARNGESTRAARAP